MFQQAQILLEQTTSKNEKSMNEKARMRKNKGKSVNEIERTKNISLLEMTINEREIYEQKTKNEIL